MTQHETTADPRTPDLPDRRPGAGPPGAHGPARAAGHGGHRCRRPHRRAVIRDPSARRMVLRHAWRPVRVDRDERVTPDDLVARSRLRWTHPLDPGVDRDSCATCASHEGFPGATSRPRRRHLGRSVAAGAAALQSRRLHLRRAGRNGQPSHQPVLVRARACSGPRRSTKWRTPCGRTPSRPTARPS